MFQNLKNNKEENHKIHIVMAIISGLYILFAFLIGNAVEGMPIAFAILMEAFVSIHMSLFVYFPLSHFLAPENTTAAFLKIFFTRVILLVILDFICPGIAIVDFIAVFIGAFIVIPITAATSSKNTVDTVVQLASQKNAATQSQNTILARCSYCGTPFKMDEKVCSGCGAPFDGDNVVVSAVTPITPPTQDYVQVSQFDPIYNKSEKELLSLFLTKELEKIGVYQYPKMIPQSQLKRKKFLYVLFALLVFIYVSLIFFHFPIATYIVGLILLLSAYWMTNRFNLVKYLSKEVKARPNEKIMNILMSTKQTLVKDDSKKIFVPATISAIVISLLLFIEPRAFYEKIDGGYALRFYAFGLTNFKEVTIPETYRDEPILSIRGNAFSNMPFLEEVNLPNTVTEIRGQAFKNDIHLSFITLPDHLEYLGGGAFYNCRALESITVPDTVTYMGGEVFKNDTSLLTVTLSKNITEIRGNSFENCEKLQTIIIPDKVTRIGGHAFYNCQDLTVVLFTENSQLQEIGSSAFRRCSSLYSITIPSSVYINERAFKESPTEIYYFGDWQTPFLP